MASHSCKYLPGQVVHHLRYDYRGVVIDIDPVFAGSEEWYRSNRSQPPQDQPWYHVLVDGGTHQTYVAESNLEADASGEPVEHPEVGEYFTDFRDGVYVSDQRALH
jgi:heat shock protein HspQ